MGKAKKGPRCPQGLSAPCHGLTGDRDLCVWPWGVWPTQWPLTPVSPQIRCMLNIWGVILYLRLPWITAQAGIGECRLRWGGGEAC